MVIPIFHVFQHCFTDSGRQHFDTQVDQECKMWGTASIKLMAAYKIGTPGILKVSCDDQLYSMYTSAFVNNISWALLHYEKHFNMHGPISKNWCNVN